MEKPVPTHIAPWRQSLGRFIAGRPFQQLIMILIVANAVVLGLQTSPTLVALFGEPLALFDRVVVMIFIVEILLRLLVHGPRFFRDPWSIFDLLVISTALIPANAHFSVLRALRVLRVLRIIAVAPSMRRVVGALLAAIPGLSSIATVLLLIFYVFGVIATHLFSEAFPDWFGHVGKSLYTLFQVMTLESWSMGISRPVMEAFPYAWAFFVPFILIATFTMLNLFIAVIVTATQNYSEAQQAEKQDALEQVVKSAESELHAELRALRQEIGELKVMLKNRDAQQRSD